MVRNKEREVYMEAFSVFSKDSETVNKSTSGGAFTEFSKEIIINGGVVFGVTLDENLRARHICIDNENDIYKIRGSKYIQSNVGHSYKEAVEYAKTRKVLFSGTPCQIAALNKFVSDDIRNNILTCEVICLGVVSQKFYDKYLDYISSGKEIKSISFRSKRIGWESFGIEIKFKDGTEYFSIARKDPFFIGFFRKVNIRPSCFECKFAKFPRQADITMGDYWGVPDYLKNKNGTSVVFCNSQSGLDFLKSIKNLSIAPTTFEDATKANPRMLSGINKNECMHKEFNKDFDSEGFRYVLKKYLKPHITEDTLWFKFKQILKRILPNVYKKYKMSR
jgi:coenzyme F420-reducing hydrogenase beta subunit